MSLKIRIAENTASDVRVLAWWDYTDGILESSHRDVVIWEASREDKETAILSYINAALLIILVLLIFPGIIFLIGFITWSSSILVYSVLCAGFGSALLASLLLYEKKSRV